VSWVSGRAVTMTDEEFVLIRDLIADYCGIFFTEAFKYLVERRLQSRLPVHGLTTFRDYYRLLKYGPDAAQEYDEVVERVTTNETYFFREPYQLKAFTDEVLPSILESRKGDSPLRIWSAGCSTGEEPYTIAMLIDEAPQFKSRMIEIFANDISRKVLLTARGGLYRDSSFRATEARYIARYFVREGPAYRLRDEIRHRVTFGHLNLMDEASLALLCNVDLIFCRNVTIYFNASSRARLLDAFHRKLRPGGYLLLGHSESLINSSTDFELVPLKNDMVYRKPIDGPGKSKS
jgi:chemotaxis protein methyltransferase CheR